MVFAMFALVGCGEAPSASRTGVGIAPPAKVKVGADGLTNEQHNIKARIEQENDPLSTKYLYIISPYTGDVLLYSTVKGKVSSSGKSLTPKEISGIWGSGGDSASTNGFLVDIGKTQAITQEVLGDDGTYGSSGEYLFWFDVRDVYHQQYIGSALIHVSNQPIAVKHAIIDIEALSGN